MTRHDHPLGYAIGNQIEIEETIECLHGQMRPDIEELVTKYGGYLLQINGGSLIGAVAIFDSILICLETEFSRSASALRPSSTQ